jgi:hypothetical protein
VRHLAPAQIIQQEGVLRSITGSIAVSNASTKAAARFAGTDYDGIRRHKAEREKADDAIIKMAAITGIF